MLTKAYIPYRGYYSTPFSRWQGKMANENDREFQKRYMFPTELRVSGKKTMLLEEDEGVTLCTEEGLAGLRPVVPDGTHTFGSQTHPADGNCALVVTTKDNAKALSADSSVEIQIVSYGYSRAKKGFMAMAVVPAVNMALEKAGITMKDVKTIFKGFRSGTG